MNQLITTALFSTMLIPLTFTGQSNEKVDVEIMVENLRNDNGNIIISIFKTEESFDQETPDEEQVYSKKEYKYKDFFQTTIKLAPGTYGIAVLDDENADSKMNYNILGVPNEGYGFSDFEHTGFTKPKFGNFSFKLFRGNKILKAIKLRYF